MAGMAPTTGTRLVAGC
uniref:Uncharacterized protein n=1 Tax=Anguilla anguilla TaxID=7936 RepID=A0A0E9RP32_ANGAN